ncbi:helix-turn-helix domain-containing protein [Paraglaciecola sp.]|jgi:transcriptional regulator with XRE-family HTH domain|uniref:helix-turn-helix domain-containing protein n=1 Tax=Paraglaciecola sp. TaxID=1920173 RepID=UPI003EF9FF0F
MDNLAVKVGEKIRSVRKEKGFSQESLALHAKLDRSYMGRIERGEANITLEMLYQLAKVLDCEAKELLP